MRLNTSIQVLILSFLALVGFAACSTSPRQRVPSSISQSTNAEHDELSGFLDELTQEHQDQRVTLDGTSSNDNNCSFEFFRNQRGEWMFKVPRCGADDCPQLGSGGNLYSGNSTYCSNFVLDDSVNGSIVYKYDRREFTFRFVTRNGKILKYVEDDKNSVLRDKPYGCTFEKSSLDP